MKRLQSIVTQGLNPTAVNVKSQAFISGFYVKQGNSSDKLSLYTNLFGQRRVGTIVFTYENYNSCVFAFI